MTSKKPDARKKAHHARLGELLEHNIHALLQVQESERNSKSLGDKIADCITAFAGSMPFVYIHAIWFFIWIFWNEGFFGLTPFDIFPYGLLTMLVSLEAIFLSTFLLISQNRMSAEANHRANLDLQINLLSEHEITRILKLVDALARHFKLPESEDREIKELESDIEPTELLRRIKAAERE